MLLITTSAKLNESAGNLNDTSKRIYDDAKLGSSECNNGLLIIYIKDRQKVSCEVFLLNPVYSKFISQLATYRGSGRFALLSDQDMARLGDLASKEPEGEESMDSLRSLLSSDDAREKADVQRAEGLAVSRGRGDLS